MQSSLNFPTTSPPPYSGSQLTSGLNGAFWSAVTSFSSGTAPTTSGLGLSSLASVSWHDTSGNALYIRDQANTTWIFCGQFDETNKIYYPAQPKPVTPTSITFADSPYTAVNSEKIDVDATSGVVQVNVGLSIAGVLIRKTDVSSNGVNISNGTSVVDQILTAPPSAGIQCPFRYVDGNGTALITHGVG